MEQASTIKQVAADTLSALQQIPGIDTSEAYAQMQLILEHCLGLSSTQQITHSEQTVTAQQLACIDEICKQRKARVPLQYCLGYAYFRGMKLHVSPGVFIPRSDTESLVQIAAKKIAKSPPAIKLIADIGTGSGAIAVALAKEFPQLKITAIDIDQQAIEQAKVNAHNLKAETQITFKQGHWADMLPHDLDLIVSNPPYLNHFHKISMPPEISQHEPKSALYGPDADGLGFYREFAVRAPEHLKSEREILLELPDGSAEAVGSIFKNAGWKQIELHKDLNGLDRVLSAVRGS